MKLIELNRLFTISYGNKLDLNKMTKIAPESPRSLAFISRTREKNGIVAYVEQIANVEPYEAGSITVALGGSVLSSFIQYEPFYTGQNIAVLQPICEMSFAVKTYYCSAIKKNAFRYSTCGREANKTLRTLLVPDISEIPKYVRVATEPDYSNIRAEFAQTSSALKFERWEGFEYQQLFKVRKGKRVTKLDLIDGKTPFISAIDKNNGIREYVGLIGLHPANTITVNYNGNGVAEAFYQDQPYWASDDVNVLYPLFELNKYIAMFVITLIRAEKYRFNYGRKWNKERMEESVMKLPVKTDGAPDFEFMENYIKSLPYSASI